MLECANCTEMFHQECLKVAYIYVLFLEVLHELEYLKSKICALLITVHVCIYYIHLYVISTCSVYHKNL